MSMRFHSHLAAIILAAALGQVAQIAAAAEGDDPCMIQPEQQVFQFTTQQSSSAGWGRMVAISNEVVAVGKGAAPGPVRIVQKQPGVGWVISQVLSPPTPSGGYFSGLTMRNDVLVIGAYSDDTLGVDAGAAYIYRSIAGTWTFEAKLLAPDGAAGDVFGSAIAFSGDTLAIGAPGSGPFPVFPGAVYTYQFDGSAWVFQQKLQADLAGVTKFGASIAGGGGDLLVGASFQNQSVFVFGFDGASWAQMQVLQRPGIGTRVVADGNWAAMAEWPAGSSPLAGTVAIYQRQRGGWVFHSEIAAEPPDVGFGNEMSLAMDGDWIIVGSPQHILFGEHVGIVRAFHRDGDAWSLGVEMGGTPTIFTNSEPKLGTAVAIHQGRVVAGEPFYSTGGLQGAGAACIYPKLIDCDANSAADPCGSPDCNTNQVPDACEAAADPASDCNGNEIPDECETMATYKLDDGSAEESWGTELGGGDFIWLNQFEVVPGMEVIDCVSIIWGPGVSVGHPMTLLVYRDGNNDGDPHDAILLRAADGYTRGAGHGGNPATQFMYQPIAPTYLGPPGQKFFIGARVVCPQKTFPMSVDSSSKQQHRGWLIAAPFQQSDLQNPTANAVHVYSPATTPIHGNFAIRALVLDCNLNGIWDGCDIAEGTSLDLNANGIPDECEHCRADFMPPGGGNAAIDLDDLLGVLDQWGATGFNAADVTASGIVDIDDLLAVINAWGPCP